MSRINFAEYISHQSFRIHVYKSKQVSQSTTNPIKFKFSHKTSYLIINFSSNNNCSSDILDEPEKSHPHGCWKITNNVQNCNEIKIFFIWWWWCMVFNATFNNISVISWQSVLLVEETGEPRKTTDLSQVTDKLYHIMLYYFINVVTLRSNYQEWRVGIPLIGLTPPPLYAYPKPGPGFPMSYVMVFFVFS